MFTKKALQRAYSIQIMRYGFDYSKHFAAFTHTPVNTRNIASYTKWYV